MLTVVEFAQRKNIGVPRVHQLLNQGVLPHKRYGNQILLYEAALKWRPRKSRPLGARLREALAADLEGVQRQVLSAKEETRLAAHLVKLEKPDAARRLADLFVNRAAAKRYRAHSQDLSDMRNDERVKLSGVSHPESRLVIDDVVEGYVTQENLPDLQREYLLSEDPLGPVILRIADAANRVRPSYLVADLADWEGPRELREAQRVLSELLDERGRNEVRAN